MRLQVENLVVSYGAVEALKGVSVEVSGAEIVAVWALTAREKPLFLRPYPALCL